MADLRNGGPPEWRAVTHRGTVPGCTMANEPKMIIIRCPQDPTGRLSETLEAQHACDEFLSVAWSCRPASFDMTDFYISENDDDDC